VPTLARRYRGNAAAKQRQNHTGRAKPHLLENLLEVVLRILADRAPPIHHSLWCHCFVRGVKGAPARVSLSVPKKSLQKNRNCQSLLTRVCCPPKGGKPLENSFSIQRVLIHCTVRSFVVGVEERVEVCTQVQMFTPGNHCAHDLSAIHFRCIIYSRQMHLVVCVPCHAGRGEGREEESGRAQDSPRANDSLAGFPARISSVICSATRRHRERCERDSLQNRVSFVV
jgi:hypothetical protein